MNGKKIAGIAILIVVIAVAVTYVIKRQTSGPSAPQELLNAKATKIDIQTGEMIERTVAEWEKLGVEQGLYRHPVTKAPTMATPIRCASCGAEIPPVVVAPSQPAQTTVQGPPDARHVAGGGVAQPSAHDQEMTLRQSYLCPKCKKPAYREGLGR